MHRGARRAGHPLVKRQEDRRRRARARRRHRQREGRLPAHDAAARASVEVAAARPRAERVRRRERVRLRAVGAAPAILPEDCPVGGAALEEGGRLAGRRAEARRARAALAAAAVGGETLHRDAVAGVAARVDDVAATVGGVDEDVHVAAAVLELDVAGLQRERPGGRRRRREDQRELRVQVVAARRREVRDARLVVGWKDWAALKTP